MTPLVTHYLWYWTNMSKFIIACGKRDRNGELLTTTLRSDVTCTRCLNTPRFKGPSSP